MAAIGSTGRAAALASWRARRSATTRALRATRRAVPYSQLATDAPQRPDFAFFARTRNVAWHASSASAVERNMRRQTPKTMPVWRATTRANAAWSPSAKRRSNSRSSADESAAFAAAATAPRNTTDALFATARPPRPTVASTRAMYGRRTGGITLQGVGVFVGWDEWSEAHRQRPGCLVGGTRSTRPTLQNPPSSLVNRHRPRLQRLRLAGRDRQAAGDRLPAEQPALVRQEHVELLAGEAHVRP